MRDFHLTRLLSRKPPHMRTMALAHTTPPPRLWHLTQLQVFGLTPPGWKPCSKMLKAESKCRYKEMGTKYNESRKVGELHRTATIISGPVRTPRCWRKHSSFKATCLLIAFLRGAIIRPCVRSMMIRLSAGQIRVSVITLVERS